jgi:hypothetical protein
MVRPNIGKGEFFLTAIAVGTKVDILILDRAQETLHQDVVITTFATCTADPDSTARSLITKADEALSALRTSAYAGSLQGGVYRSIPSTHSGRAK